ASIASASMVFPEEAWPAMAKLRRSAARKVFIVRLELGITFLKESAHGQQYSQARHSQPIPEIPKASSRSRARPRSTRRRGEPGRAARQKERRTRATRDRRRRARGRRRPLAHAPRARSRRERRRNPPRRPALDHEHRFSEHDGRDELGGRRARG